MGRFKSRWEMSPSEPGTTRSMDAMTSSMGHDVPADAVGPGAIVGGLGAPNEGLRRVVHVLHVVPPAVPDHVRAA